MKYTTQFECMNKNCNTIVLGTNRMDGISCPRCNGPVSPQPFIPFTKHEITLAVYQCLCCGHRDRVQGSKEDYSEVKVCPKCNGAFVDVWHIAKYKKQPETSIVHDIVIPSTIDIKQIAKQIAKLIERGQCRDGKGMG